MIAAIACVDENFGIGSSGNLLFRCKADMDRFRELTNNKVVIVGRKTYETLSKRPLPNRTNVVVSRNPYAQKEPDGSIWVDMERAKAVIETFHDHGNDVFVIGGEQIYRELLPMCDTLYLTKVLHAYDNVDSYFPNITESGEWEAVESSDMMHNDDTAYYFVKLKRKHDKD